jgi:hypothetical protein
MFLIKIVCVCLCKSVAKFFSLQLDCDLIQLDHEKISSLFRSL